MCRNWGSSFNTFPVGCNEILFASWLSNNWKTKPVAHHRQSYGLFACSCPWEKNTCVSADGWECILVLPRCTFFLQAVSLLLLFATERLYRETWGRTNAVWTEDIGLTTACPWRVVTIPRFVFDRLREVGKAVTWKQHGKLFYPFALEGGLGWRALVECCERTGIVVAKASLCVIWLRLLWGQMLTLALLERRE